MKVESRQAIGPVIAAIFIIAATLIASAAIIFYVFGLSSQPPPKQVVCERVLTTSGSITTIFINGTRTQTIEPSNSTTTITYTGYIGNGGHGC